MKAKAFLTVLSKKFRDGQVLFVESFDMKTPKTAEAKAALVALAKNKGYEKLGKRQNAALIALSKKDTNIEKSFRNIGSILVEEARNANLLDLLKYTYVVIENPTETVKLIEAKL